MNNNIYIYMSYFSSSNTNIARDLTVSTKITSKGAVSGSGFYGVDGISSWTNFYPSINPGHCWVFSQGIQYQNMYQANQYDHRAVMNFGFTYSDMTLQIKTTLNDIYTVMSSYKLPMTVSDYRVKENFRTPKNNILERLCSINIFDYNFKNIFNVVYENKDPINQIGFFAHELQEMFPEYQNIVFHKKDQVNENGSMEIQHINSFTFSNILMKSIQEQNNEANQLKLEIQEQNEKINQLILTVQALKAKVQELKSK